MIGTIFNERLVEGQAAEVLALKAFMEQLYPNKGCGFGPQVVETEWNDKKRSEIMANKVLGDLWFMGMDDVLYRVDVKKGRWIAKDSILNFTTENSFYFLNAGTLTGSKVYLLLKFDQAMKDWILTLPNTPMITKDNTSDGFVIHYDDIPPSLNCNIMEIDPNQYHKILVDRIVECSEMDPPINSYIKRE